MLYSSSLYCAKLPTYPLQQRYYQQACEFLKLIIQPHSCLHCMLPARHDKDLIARLRFP